MTQVFKLALAMILFLGATPLVRAQLDESRLDRDVLVDATRHVHRDVAKGTVEVLGSRRGRPRVAYGCVLDEEGWILTKASELREQSPIRVRLHDARVLVAEVCTRDDEHDIALLKIEADNLTAVPWDLTANIEPGVVVISPRKAGDLRAESLGIVSVGPRAIEAARGYLGVYLEKGESAGARVVEILDGTPAMSAGLQAGDLIVRIDGAFVRDERHAISKIKLRRPGQSVELRVKRDDSTMTIRPELSHHPGEMNARDRSLEGRRSRVRMGFPWAFQHDSPLDPEDCGGPLASAEGKAIAMNIARSGRIGSYAIPAHTVVEVGEKLKLKHQNKKPVER